MDEHVPIPWGQIAVVALLGIALGIAIASHHTWDSVIIGVLLVPGAAIVGTSLYFRWKRAHQERTER